MILSDIIKNPIESLDYMERMVNDGSPSNFTFINTTSLQTSPFHVDSFRICQVLDNFGTLKTYGSLPPFDKKHISSDIGFIFAHPDWQQTSIGSYIQNSSVIVRPTASSRTVRIDNEDLYCKLCYPGILGRITRELYECHVLASIENTSILQSISSYSNSPKELAFLPESSGKVMKVMDYEIGCVYRSAKPQGKNTDSICAMIPAFSLFSKDKKRKDDKPLIIQLCEKQTEPAFSFILNRLIIPLINCFFFCLTNGGLLLELHSQNFLIGIDSNFRVLSIILRDFESIDRDLTLSNELGLPFELPSNPYKCIHKNQYNYKIKHSFMYDHKLCEYFFDPLIQCLTHYGIEGAAQLEQAIKSYVRSSFSDITNNFFPDDNRWYKFKNTVIDRSVSARPYISYANPKYR